MEKDLLDHELPVEEILDSSPPEDTTPPWEEPGREVKPDNPPEDTLAAKRAELEEREERLAAMERRYHTQERLISLRLSLDLLEHFDFSSDEAVEKMLILVEKMAASSQKAVNPGPPPASIPAVTMPETYNERAQMYRRDPMGYRTVQRTKG